MDASRRRLVPGVTQRWPSDRTHFNTSTSAAIYFRRVVFDRNSQRPASRNPPVDRRSGLPRAWLSSDLLCNPAGIFRDVNLSRFARNLSGHSVIQRLDSGGRVRTRWHRNGDIGARNLPEGAWQCPCVQLFVGTEHPYTCGGARLTPTHPALAAEVRCPFEYC